jgi:class 3 adenylate cyclase
LVERNDLGGLADWYEQEAARLRGKAEEMRQMAELYAKPSYQPAPKESKRELIAHCRLFIDHYTNAAEEAEALARLHREHH